MAVPTRTETLNTFVAATAQHRRKDLVDNFFESASLYAKMRKRGNTPLRGGEEIRVPHIYTGMTASSYGRGDEFDTSTKEFATVMRFNWKFSYAAINLDVIDVELNDSPEQTFDLVDAAMETAELSLVDDMSDQLFGDGTGNGSKDIDGLAIAISRTGSYGGITRGTDAQGASIRAAFEDTTGGSITLANMNTQYGVAVIAREAPDLLVTTRTLWSRIWERSQPSERNEPSDMRDIGFKVVRFNGADVTVDSHCPTGLVYFLNTKWWDWYTHSKWDFRFRGFMEPTNQQRAIGQLITWGNLVCRSPRMNGVMSGLT